MHIYHKQCEIIQKNQWKGPNFQTQCFYNGRSLTDRSSLLIIPSQMEVQHRNVALLDPQGTHRTQTLKEHLETSKFREKKKRDQGSSGVCRAGGTNVGLRAFGAQAVMLRYVVLRLLTTKCYKKPKFATKKCCKIAKISHKQPKVAIKCQKPTKMTR